LNRRRDAEISPDGGSAPGLDRVPVAGSEGSLLRLALLHSMLLERGDEYGATAAASFCGGRLWRTRLQLLEIRNLMLFDATLAALLRQVARRVGRPQDISSAAEPGIHRYQSNARADREAAAFPSWKCRTKLQRERGAQRRRVRRSARSPCRRARSHCAHGRSVQQSVNDKLAAYFSSKQQSGGLVVMRQDLGIGKPILFRSMARFADGIKFAFE
jgi:hypothetical protein